ncbi:hypothetical protein UFOVP1454_46 [uncultured Caudovirales phage]|uniref:Uncharacterized protein n=1 Tax=uncultured Caudovirales phage TaxID=2100421 RepID=A0A6J5SJC6_9CAUD|nr:hypothetical protein UFOVP1454_46 [uncultured Caudovirales phage]
MASLASIRVKLQKIEEAIASLRKEFDEAVVALLKK